jgi:4-hydroxy-tetrahydrodipicolinate reductase
MNIALIGYGRMGHEIETMAVKRGHKIGLIIDISNMADLDKDHVAGIDVAIEFSSPESAFNNVSKCLGFSVPVVSGTTGWLDNYDNAVALCKKMNTAFIHSSNFSLGVNLLFKLNKDLAALISKYNEYSPAIEEIHHTKKLDAPSGTALSLVRGIMEGHPGFKGWSFDDESSEGMIPVNAVREGDVPGIHIVTWDSEIDTITLRHEAKNRRGLALGAVVAAEYIHSRKGVFTMNDIMGF